MAAISESHATLQMFGDTLEPAEITALLGGEPTHSQKKGQEIRSPKTGQVRIVRQGSWRCRSAPQHPANLDVQVAGLLEGLTDDMEIWRGIAARFKLRLFCGLFLKAANEGLEVSPATLLALGQRGISLGLDVYGPLDEDKDVDG